MMSLLILLYTALFTNFVAEDTYYLKDSPVVMYFPDDDENPVATIIDPKDDVADEVSLTDSITNFANILPPGYTKHLENYIFFYLYTRRGRSQLYVGNVTSLNEATFNASLPTRLITHGYITSEHSGSVQRIKNKYLEVEDCNVIAVDWCKLGCNVEYGTAKSRTKVVGSYVAKLIDFLVHEARLKLEDVHLIGHSLGAHVMGLAGKNVESGKVARITGLDPAGVLYNIKNERNRLALGDAEFVDILHTCGGHLAFIEPLGDVDFYPNKGRMPQNGCHAEVYGSCSHSRAWKYFAESIGSDAFKAVPCDSYYDYRAGKCDHFPKVSMGHPCTSKTRGTHYLTTKSKSPFALG